MFFIVIFSKCYIWSATSIYMCVFIYITQTQEEQQKMEVSKVTKLGSSLHVPSVLELAKEKIDAAPSRYIRSDQVPVLSSANPAIEVPVIDLQLLLDGDLLETELNKLHQACKEWGFFQVSNNISN